MVRTQIQLTEEQATALKSKAAFLGVSMAELIRRGVDSILEPIEHRPSADRSRRAIEAAGRFQSGLGDVADNHDRYVAEAYRK